METVVELNSLVAALRDVGVFAVLMVITVYIIARSPFSFRIEGTYSFSVGKNGHYTSPGVITYAQREREQLAAPHGNNQRSSALVEQAPADGASKD